MPSDTKKRTGRVYQLVNMITNEKYIGSTFQTLYKRQFDRRQNYNRWLKGKSHFNDNHQLFNNIHEYGWESFRIELLAEVEVNTKAELYKIEGDYIRKYDTFNDGLNGAIPNRDRKEYMKQYQQDNKDKFANYRKKYYQNNKDKIGNYRKKYYQNNKDKIITQVKQYQQNNKDKIANREKQYYQNNKDKIGKRHKQYNKHYQKNNSQKFNCTFCNYSTYHKTDYTKHLNTQKHKFAVMY